MLQIVQRYLGAVAVAAIMALPAALPAQEPGQGGGMGGGQFAGMQRVAGEVTAVTATSLTVKAQDGVIYQVTATDNTRIMKGRGTAVKLADLKTGDGVMAMGNLDAPTKTLHAAILVATDAAQVKALKDNMGKTYIAGKVAAINLDDAKMTVERQDGVSQTIGFDETTSFKRGGIGGLGGMNFGQREAGSAPPNGNAPPGESITLADIKVGDNIIGQGSLKAGIFVPTQLSVIPPGRRRRPEGAATPGAGAPAAQPKQ